MDFIVTDRKSIERGLVVRSAYVVVSIHDPAKRPPQIPRAAGLRDVLQVAFDDAEPVEGFALPAGVTLISEQHARAIWEFVRKWERQVGAVVVHCEQGMSRSPAVAAALCRACGGDHRRFFREYQPNHYVFRLMVRCAQPE